MNKMNFSIIDEYISYNDLYKDQYEHYIVLLQVGSFYEMYSIIQDDPKLKEVCELLNLLLTRKNKTIQKISKSNPHMAGFPCVSIQKNLDMLIENNYTIFEDYKDEVIWQTWDDMNEKYGNDEDNPPPVKADLFFKLIELKFLDKIKNRWKKFKIR
jgi:hypothetical protein